MPGEMPGVDYPAVRRKPPSRAPLIGGAIVVLLVLTGWLGSQILGGDPVSTATPRATIAARTPTTAPPRETPVSSAVAIATATPVVATATPVAATPTPVRATPKPTAVPTQAAAPVYGLLVINTNPWSEVRIGGRNSEPSPVAMSTALVS